VSNSGSDAKPAGAAKAGVGRVGARKDGRGFAGVRAAATRWAPPVVSLLVAMLIFQAFVSLDLGKLKMPGPLDVLHSIVTFGVSGEFWSAALESGRVFLQGLIPGMILGVFIGLVVGGFRLLDRSLGPLLFGVYTTPFIAIIPLLLILFGFGVKGKTMIVFFLVFITVVLQTIAGVRNVDPTYFEVSNAFRAPPWRRLFEVTFPAALPFIVAGIRLGIGRALVGVVVAEFETQVTGLGGVIIAKAQRLELADAMIPAIFLAAVGIALAAALRRWEQRIQVWKS